MADDVLVSSPEDTAGPLPAFEGNGLLLAGVLGGLLAVVGAAAAAAELGAANGGPVLVVVVGLTMLLLAWTAPLALRAPGAPGSALVCLVVGAVALVATRRSDPDDALAIALGLLVPLAFLHQIVRNPRTGAASSLTATVVAGALVVAPSAWLVLAAMRPGVAAAGLAAVGAASVASRLVDALRPVPLLLAEPRRGLAAVGAAALAGGVAGFVLALAASGDIAPLGGLGLGLVCGLLVSLGDLTACALALPAPGATAAPWRGPAEGRAGAVALQAVLPLALAAAPALALGRLAAGS